MEAIARSRYRLSKPRQLDPNNNYPALRKIHDGLSRRIVGQSAAINAVLQTHSLDLAGLSDPERPLGNFLLLGQTGSGKTRFCEAVAEVFLGTADALIKINCAEYPHRHEISKLIGAPPGYLGHRETKPILSQELLNQHHTPTHKLSIVLFDEIEKAGAALHNLLLGIFDKGILTLGNNKRVDFSRCMNFCTSNLGAQKILAIANGLGFSKQSLPSRKLELVTNRAVRRRFNPEFINRFDHVVTFNSLTVSDLHGIFDLEMLEVSARLVHAGYYIDLNVSPEVKDHILTSGYDARYGARALKRVIQRLIVQPLSNLMLTRQVNSIDRLSIELDPDTNEILFYKD